MSDTIFEAKNTTFAYPGCEAVINDVSFTITEGESVAILGANASGKSTLLHLLDGLYFPTKGSIYAFGTKLTEDTVETPPFSAEFRSKVGFVFQNSDAQLFCTTVEEELAFGPLQLGLSQEEVKERVSDGLSMLDIERLRDRSPQTLRGGEKKRVALASVITCAPRVILLDEPSTGLDPRTQQWLTEFLGLLRDSGITTVISSHDLGFIAETTDRALILAEDHTLVYDGPLRTALEDLNLLLSVNLIHAHAHVHDGEVHSHPHLHAAWHDHSHKQ